MLLRIPVVPLLLGASLLLAGGCLHPHWPAAITGILAGDHVWTGEVYLAGDVILAPEARLTIRPGTTVYFLPPQGAPGGLTEHPHFPGSELIVQGQLSALGTAAAPIRFVAADRQAPAGSWGALNFEAGAEGAFAYCLFRQADSAIHSRDSRVTIAESLFEDNLVGIRFHSSTMRIEHNLLRNNGVAIRFHFGAPEVRYNRFATNRVNLFITAHPRDYLFANNHFDTPLEYQVVLGEEVPEEVNLAGNAWSSGAPAELNERLFDGRAVPYLGTVQVEPLLAKPPEGVGPAWIR